jgi:hypothetical protein
MTRRRLQVLSATRACLGQSRPGANHHQLLATCLPSPLGLHAFLTLLWVGELTHAEHRTLALRAAPAIWNV